MILGRLRRILTIVLLIGALAPGLAFADPLADFEKGKNAYLYGDFTKVIAIFDPLVGVENQEKLEDPRTLADALEMLGLSRYYLGEEATANDIFQRLIIMDPDRALSPITAPPDVVAVYDALKVELKAEIEIARETLERERERERQRTQIRVVVNHRRNSKWVTVVPFGVGQFQNGDNAWGGFFLGSELLAVSLSTVFYFAAQELRQPDGFFDRGEDVTLARNLRTAQFVSGGAALALMIGGAIHAAYTFEPMAETRRERIKPTISPAGAGILIEF